LLFVASSVKTAVRNSSTMSCTGVPSQGRLETLAQSVGWEIFSGMAGRTSVRCADSFSHAVSHEREAEVRAHRVRIATMSVTYTRKALRILRVFLDHPDQRLYGLDVARMAGFDAGTIYPSLLKLERSGWLQSDWDPAPLAAGQKYRRRQYWLNPARLEGVPDHE
jgi:Transcriptional regulator PadR-like family